MQRSNAKLTAAVETYLTEMRRVRASGGATGERSSYGPLANLLNAVGATLRPKVFCVAELADQGAGHPDFGLFTARQVQRGRPRDGQVPERGVVEVKAPRDSTRAMVVREQVSRYWGRYGLVLVTNLRDFELVGRDAADGETILESFRLAGSSDEFERLLEKPQSLARAAGAGLGEYLRRALSHRSTIAEPKDLAWLLASYARDGLTRVEAAGEAPSLAAVRSALEDALGVRFEGDRGARFFRSTLVQTLFYGVFSAWVLWARTVPSPAGAFDWRTAVWHLRAPVLRALFQQISDPGRLQPLGLVDVLDWAAAALDRVDRSAFFARFREGEAVPYFYEPFLQAFDPELRKQLGVWYTPAEVVRYMVARVDKALKDDLDIAEGLAADHVYVLDPCCGTGAYLAEVLRRIAANLQGRGLGALTGARVKQAAMQRVFGFEIMPAPFVVAHLQVGLTMEALDAPLADDGRERAGVYLTNALTGWEPRTTKPLPFPELDLDRLRKRIADYFDPSVSHEEIARRYPAAMKTTARFDAKAVRGTLIGRGGPDERGFVRYAYRPLDNRWLYWEADTKLLDEKRADYRPHVFDGNPWIEAREREAKEGFSRETPVRHLADNLGNGLSSFFPLWLSGDGLAVGPATGRRPNVSSAAQRYLHRVGATVEDLFHHVLAVLQDPVYRQANAGALRIEWPRIPLPGWSDGTAGAPLLAEWAARGREVPTCSIPTGRCPA